MEQEIRLKRLAAVEAHVSAGLRHIAGQRGTIVELERDGHDTSFAKRLLAALLQSQALHEGDRDRLIRKLGAA
jgi:hypothetical protein